MYVNALPLIENGENPFANYEQFQPSERATPRKAI